MKGILLAGGTASRLFPATLAVSKQMLPVYDKPMIYYPLSCLMMAGIRDVLVISTPKHLPAFSDLLGDGSDYGMSFTYKIQEKPAGLADAFRVGKDYIGNDNVCLILGDNMIYGSRLERMLKAASNLKKGGIIFGYQVADPTSYGVVEIDDKGKAISIEEKPKHPKSNYAVTGMYFYNNEVVKIAKGLKKSARGEYEITDVNEAYLKAGKLDVKQLGRGYAWLDTGTVDALLDAANFIKTIESLQGIQISAPEEIAYNNRWITKAKLLESAEAYGKSIYGRHLLKVARGEILYNNPNPNGKAQVKRPVWGKEQ